MDRYLDLCRDLRMPLWLAPLLKAAARQKNDHTRRKYAYKSIQRHLLFYRVGCTAVNRRPTYIYPAELKDMIRTVFPVGVCSYPDPRSDKTYVVTLEDLHHASPAHQSCVVYE